MLLPLVDLAASVAIIGTGAGPGAGATTAGFDSAALAAPLMSRLARAQEQAATSVLQSDPLRGWGCVSETAPRVSFVTSLGYSPVERHAELLSVISSQALEGVDISYERASQLFDE